MMRAFTKLNSLCQVLVYRVNMSPLAFSIEPQKCALSKKISFTTSLETFKIRLWYWNNSCIHKNVKNCGKNK